MRKGSTLQLKLRQLTSQTKSNLLQYNQRNILTMDSLERLSLLNGKYTGFMAKFVCARDSGAQHSIVDTFPLEHMAGVEPARFVLQKILLNIIITTICFMNYAFYIVIIYSLLRIINHSIVFRLKFVVI